MRYSDRLRAGRPGFDSGRGNIFLFSTNHFQGVPEAKWETREDHHSPTPSAELNN